MEVVTPEWTWMSAAGYCSPLSSESLDSDMRFLIASVTKLVTSIVILKLAEEGKLSLADPIERWLPAYLMDRIPNGKEMTIRQLLDHTSGIADYDKELINLEELHNPDVPIPCQVSIEQGLSASPLFSPGTNYTYSNVNYILLTLIIDAASGIPYEDYVTRNIIIPAGLKHVYSAYQSYTRPTHPGDNAKRKRDDK
ncbi:serine hydrolase domain-containing protein [Methanospirillum hungatei]|uniref:serine hydrolase domain-containing protein n=1 Tax=Methanospirillum hungatei TaxID=2203 RepID=UPI002BBDECCB|nr:serine hydrolase domain-containing protein [Methanospirillum hungatei]HOW05809.1 serine hydrolase domain-containing protein [Methanospirillum hungatei]